MNFEITKREVLASISIVAVMIMIGIFISNKIYPRCILSSGPSRKIENGAEEVAELEMTIDLMPDENGECMYEALESELESEEIKQQWLTNFSLELVKAV